MQNSQITGLEKKKKVRVQKVAFPNHLKISLKKLKLKV